MTNSEKELFSAVPANEFNTYWVPCTWFIYRLKEAAKMNKLLNPYALVNRFKRTKSVVTLR
jgi:bestrophin-3